MDLEEDKEGGGKVAPLDEEVMLVPACAERRGCVAIQSVPIVDIP